MSAAACSWCDAAVSAGDGYRLAELGTGRRAAFCRLEHLVPWAIQGAEWEKGVREGVPAEVPAACAECGDEVGGSGVVLVRHRDDHRIPDGFCTLDHALTWAKAGGRWR